MDYVHKFGSDFSPEPDDDVMESIFKQYERIIVESLITSFGLDFLVKDRHGGDADTINNVRKIGSDPQMVYKNKVNEDAYNNRGKYNDRDYKRILITKRCNTQREMIIARLAEQLRMLILEASCIS